MAENVNISLVNTGNVSNIKAFSIGDDWEILFSEYLDQFLKANRIDEDRKASTLIPSISEEAYAIKILLIS